MAGPISRRHPYPSTGSSGASRHLDTAGAQTHFLRDPDWPRLAAPVPALATAVAFVVAWMDWGSDYADTMARTIQLEFLVIHAGLFIGVFVLLPVETATFRALRWVAVSLLALLYGSGGYKLLGWHGVLMIGGAFAGTYGGFVLSRLASGAGDGPRGRTIVEIAVRWVVSLLAYLLTAEALGLPELVNEWIDLRASVALGGLYFAALGVVEASGLYPRIRGRPRGQQRPGQAASLPSPGR